VGDAGASQHTGDLEGGAFEPQFESDAAVAQVA
jgi:hypothetical protein